MLATIENITSRLNLSYEVSHGTWWLNDEQGTLIPEFCANDVDTFLANLRRLETEHMALPVEQLRHDLYGYISDASKDAQGFRERFDISGATTAALFAECDEWSRRVARALEEERRFEEQAVARFEQRLAEAVALGAADRATAVRWLMDAELSPEETDREGYFKYLAGLPYEYDLVEGRS